METAAALAAEVRGLGREHRREPYPEDLRWRVAAYCRRAKRRGLGWRRLAGLLGVGQTTLVRWCREDEDWRPESRDSLGFVPVVVDSADIAVEGPARLPILVRSPSGLEVEGLGLEEVAWLLRTLG